MARSLGIETTERRCKACSWCATYYDRDVIKNTETPVYFCTCPKITTITHPCEWKSPRHANDATDDD